MLTVAIASENDVYDGEVYRTLLESMLGIEVKKWQSEMRFSGEGSVFKLIEPYLKSASAKGIRHALLAVDNDGGSKRRLEHEATHDAVAQASDTGDGCRTCRLQHALPAFGLPRSVDR